MDYSYTLFIVPISIILIGLVFGAVIGRMLDYMGY